MKDDSNPAVRSYLRTLTRELSDVPAGAREAIVDDVRAHIDDALESGRDVDDVIASLGSPDDVARQSRAELQVFTRDGATSDARARVAFRVLSSAAIALAVVTAVFVSFLLPAFTTADGSGEIAVQTLFQSYGPAIALLTLAPAVLVTVPLLVRGRVRVAIVITVSVLLTLFAFVSGFTIGGFYAPIALAMWAVAIVPWRVQHGLDLARSWLWRIVGAVVLLLPALLIVPGRVTGAVENSPGLWGAAGLALGCGTLFLLGHRAGMLIIAAVGGIVMILAMAGGGLLILLLWLVGGVYLVAGLAGFAATGARGAPSSSA